jgi:hypothetical protein
MRCSPDLWVSQSVSIKISIDMDMSSELDGKLWLQAIECDI